MSDPMPINTKKMQTLIETAFSNRLKLDSTFIQQTLKPMLNEILGLLESGQLRIAKPIKNNTWEVYEWLKKAILLFFQVTSNNIISSGYTHFYDKVPLRFVNTTIDDISQSGARVVPHALIRRGAFVGKQVVVMPSYINIGAFVDEGTMVDTWATIGSCAQIGKHVHISGGVGIGGVLEPLQAQPTIVEDNCFIGARSEIVEGVVVEKNTVISMGVFIGQSTPIYNRSTKKISYGRIPAGSVVVAGSLPAKDGSHHLNCAVIVKTVDEKTRSKVSINEILRDSTPTL